MIIMGVDPGTRSLGVALLDLDKGQNVRSLHYEAIQSPASKPLYQRLGHISNSLEELFSKFEPHVVVLEKSFFGVNMSTAIRMGEARGVVMSLAGRFLCDLMEFTPNSVKSAIVGHGHATKEQMQGMVKRLLGIRGDFATHDESDALALALCYVFRNKSQMRAYV